MAAMSDYRNITGEIISVIGNNYFVNGKPVKKAKIVSKRGRGKWRPCWEGEAWTATLMAFQLGIVINDGTEWYVLLETEDGPTAMTYTDFLKVK